MRREEIIEGAVQIILSVRESELLPILDLASSPGAKDALPPEPTNKVLAGLKHFTLKVETFSPAARRMAAILKLDRLTNPATWSELIAGEQRRLIAIQHHRRVQSILEFLPNFIELVEHESHLPFKYTEGTKYQDKEILSVIVIEDNNRLSSPERLVEVLESVDVLYRACALMLGLRPEGLAVISCDSGSDKSFDFLGAAKVIECLKEFILSLWDRVVFFRERQLEQRIELVNKSLPIYERLGELVKEKRIEPEMAEIIRRDVFEATGKFIKSGATIPELKNVSEHNPRVLMAPEPKLLVSAPEGATVETAPPEGADDEGAEDRTDAEQSTQEGLNFDNLGDDERAALLRLLEKARQKDNQEPVDVRPVDDSPDE